MLEVLANIGFLLNAFNLLPIGFLDGGSIARAIGEAWRMPVIRFEGGVPVQAFAPDRTRALAIATLYFAARRRARARHARNPTERDALDGRRPRMLEAHETLDELRRHVESIARRVLRRLRGGRPDRPAGGLGLRVGAGARRAPSPTSSARETGRLFGAAGWAVVPAAGRA